jgi:hypothetical protein
MNALLVLVTHMCIHRGVDASNPFSVFGEAAQSSLQQSVSPAATKDSDSASGQRAPGLGSSCFRGTQAAGLQQQRILLSPGRGAQLAATQAGEHGVNVTCV